MIIRELHQNWNEREWVCEAICKLRREMNRSSDTHLINIDFPFNKEISLYLKDESVHPTGSLKHRLARSLFLYGLCNGHISSLTPIIEASSGSTAISEAYFAKLLGIPFIAVMPKGISKQKIEQIEFYGGECQFVGCQDIYIKAQELADRYKGIYLDQFTNAEKATDWRGNNNIAECLFEQLKNEPYPIPEWVVVGAGTGGSSATIGRYIRYQPEFFTKTKLCVVDPENSVFYDYYKTGNRALKCNRGSRIEGIGRPRVELSFLPELVDRMEKIPDAASFAAIWWFKKYYGRYIGGSTGTNLIGVFRLVSELCARHKKGSIVSLICDAGDRYMDTYFDQGWLKENQIELTPYMVAIEDFMKTGNWQEPA